MESRLGRSHFVLLPTWVKKTVQTKGTMELTDLREWAQLQHQNVQVDSSDVAVEAVEDKEPASKVWVHPHNPARGIWDLASMLMVLYDMVVIPLQLFELNSDFFVVMAWVTRLFWTFDVPLTFLSGQVTKAGQIELDRRVIGRQYLRSWFIIDFCMVVVDWMEMMIRFLHSSFAGAARLGKVTRIFRIMRLLRLLRVAKMGNVLTTFTEQVNSERWRVTFSLIKLMLLVLLASHVLACCWYAIGRMDESSSWLENYSEEEKSEGFWYILSYRWSLSQFGGGMDQVAPTTLAEHFYALLAYLIAFWSGAVILSLVTSLMTQFLLDGSHQNIQLSILRRYLEQNRISKALCLRLSRNAKCALAERRRMIQEESVQAVRLISEPLRRELRFELYGPGLAVHPFFEMYIQSCQYIMKLICHKAMSMSIVAAGDIIFTAGESPQRPRMYTVNCGVLQYSMHALHTQSVDKDKWVSEAALWIAWTHRGTLTAFYDCRLYLLDAKEFQAIASNYEYSKDFNPTVYASSLVTYMNSLEAKDVTDVLSACEVEAAVLNKSHSIGGSGRRTRPGRPMPPRHQRT